MVWPTVNDHDESVCKGKNVFSVLFQNESLRFKNLPKFTFLILVKKSNEPTLYHVLLVLFLSQANPYLTSIYPTLYPGVYLDYPGL